MSSPVYDERPLSIDERIADILEMEEPDEEMLKAIEASEKW